MCQEDRIEELCRKFTRILRDETMLMLIEDIVNDSSDDSYEESKDAMDIARYLKEWLRG